MPRPISPPDVTKLFYRLDSTCVSDFRCPQSVNFLNKHLGQYLDEAFLPLDNEHRYYLCGKMYDFLTDDREEMLPLYKENMSFMLATALPQIKPAGHSYIFEELMNEICENKNLSQAFLNGITHYIQTVPKDQDKDTRINATQDYCTSVDPVLNRITKNFPRLNEQALVLHDKFIDIIATEALLPL